MVLLLKRSSEEMMMEIDIERTGTWLAYGKTLSSQTESRSFDGKPRFTDYIAAHFPEVAATIDQTNIGVLHAEVGALKLATHKAINRSDWTTVSAHFTLVDTVLESADVELHDVIGADYLINLFYDEISQNHAKARVLMPKRLAKALEIIERHYEELASSVAPSFMS
jgi:hypothetical protein